MVKVNDTFTDTYADGMVRFTVIEKRTGDVWNCKVLQDMDWAGLERVYTTAQIEAAKARDASWRRSANDHDTWWGSRTVGEVVHYSNGFRQFVRGVIVETEGKLQMVPTALVGEWRTFDLPYYRKDGEIDFKHYPRAINEKTPMQPNCSNMYEYPGSQSSRERFDPTDMLAIDLTPVPLLPELQAQVPYERARLALIELLQSGHADPKAALSNAKSLLTDVFENGASVKLIKENGKTTIQIDSVHVSDTPLRVGVIQGNQVFEIKS